MQPIIMLALVGVAAMAMSMRFLTNTFVLNVQTLGVAEEDLISPIKTANVDLELTRLVAGPDGDSTRTHYHNVIHQCSFHTFTTLGTCSTIICKLTDLDDDVIAEGKVVLARTLTGSSDYMFIPIDNLAYPNANDVQKVHDVKIV